MWLIVAASVKVLAVAVGMSCLYLLFLYENREQKVQNLLEEWWIRLDDQKNSILAWHTLFMREVAKSVTWQLDLLFGRTLVSYQSFSVSLLFTLGFASLFLVFYPPLEWWIRASLVFSGGVSFYALFKCATAPLLGTLGVVRGWCWLTVLSDGLCPIS